MSFEFDDILADDAAAFISTFGEKRKLVYRPADGPPRSIKAIVRRNPIEGVPGLQQAQSKPFEIEVENNEKTGIAAHKLNTGGDKIEIERVKKGPVELRSITRIIDQDAGMLTLEIW